MKSRKLVGAVLSAALLVTVPGVLHAQLPCNTYGGNQDDRGHALVEATPGGWVVAGWTRSFGIGAPGFKNLLVVRTDSAGIPVNALYSNLPQDEEITSIDVAADGGYVMCGFTNSPVGIGAPGNVNIIVIKTDSLLNLQWAMIYGDTSGDEYAWSIKADPFGAGYTLCGHTTSPAWGPAPYPNLLVMRVNSFGVPVVTRTYFNPARPLMEEAYGLTRLPVVGQTRVGYVVAGRWAEPGIDTLWDGFVLRLDTEALPVTPGPVRVIPGSGVEEAYAVAANGRDPFRYTVAGWTSTWGPGRPHANIWAVRFSEIGQPVVWRKVYGWQADDELLKDDRSLAALADKGCVLGGWTCSKGPGTPQPNFLLLRIDSLGAVVWSRVHPSSGGNRPEQAYPIVVNRSGGFAAAGFTNSFGSGGDDFHLLTLDPAGNRPACVDSPAIDVDTIVVTRDTISSYTVSPVEVPLTIDETTLACTEVCPLVGIDEDLLHEAVPAGVKLLTGLTSRIQLYVSVAGIHRLRLLDGSGRVVATLARGWFPVGRYDFTIPEHAAAGVYYLDATANRRHVTAKIIRF